MRPVIRLHMLPAPIREPMLDGKLVDGGVDGPIPFELEEDEEVASAMYGGPGPVTGPDRSGIGT